MTIRFYATLRDIVGSRAVDLDLPAGTTVQAMLAGLFQRYPRLEPRVLDEAGELRHAVNIFVNGRSIRFLDGLATELPLDAELAIFPPVAGG